MLSLEVLGFVLGTVVSLVASWVLVTRIERIAGRLGVTDSVLGLLAALAADAPEITSAASALVGHRQEVGAGIVVGSNVFNLAALLGFGAVTAGWVMLRRRVVVVTGAVSIWIAAACLLTLLGWLPAGIALLLVLGALGLYIWAAAHRRPDCHGEPPRHPIAQHSSRWDLFVITLALGVVVVASIVMERAATSLGRRLSVSDIVVGAVVLAAVTSLPNVVAALYLARRGRGSAMLSTALNSNALNVAVGLLLPATLVGLGPATEAEVFVAMWYLGLTVGVLVLAYLNGGLRRRTGLVILAAYALFVILLVADAHG